MDERVMRIYIKFLSDFFPIKKIREKRRFHKGILMAKWVDNRVKSVYFIENEGDLLILTNIIGKILSNVFNLTIETSQQLFLDYILRNNIIISANHTNMKNKRNKGIKKRTER